MGREELLALCLGDLACAERLVEESRPPDPPAAPRCSLGGWSGTSSGRTTDATAAQVRGLWSLLIDPHAGDRHRADFVALLVAQPVAESESELDATRARAALTRLQGAEGLRRQVLDALAAYCRPGTAWDTAAGVVADACAPREVRATWERTYQHPRAGRPTRDTTAPPPEVVRLEWGGGLLEAVVRWWGGEG